MMELNDQNVKVELDTKTAVGLKMELDSYRSKWKELEYKGEKFVLEIKKGLSDIESLANKFTSLETEKIRIENEFMVLKQGNMEVEKKINDFGIEKGGNDVVDLTCDEEDEMTQLMIENKVLECEKKAAESMVEDLKSKCWRLEMENSALRKEKLFFDKDINLGENVKTRHEKTHPIRVGDSQETGTPLDSIASDRFTQVEDVVCPFEPASLYGTRVRKKLAFVEELRIGKKIAPSTPGTKRPSYCVIDIINSQDDQEHNTNDHMSHIGSLKNEIANEGDTSNFLFVPTHKRKRAFNIIVSDRESSDDNIPIGALRNKHLPNDKDDIVDFYLSDSVKEYASPRRRLVRKCDKKVLGRSSPNCSGEFFKNESVEDDEDEIRSKTESESLSGFIVSGSNISESDNSSSESNKVWGDDVDFNEVISKIRKKRDKKVIWEFEADMLADFGKDIELCMKAVCALYRKQTPDEKCIKWTIYLNQRGFSQCDAPRGTDLAEFLCDGDPERDVCKSVDELREYNPEGPELCRTLATHYSKQLFAIYKNKEDPFFAPSNGDYS